MLYISFAKKLSELLLYVITNFESCRGAALLLSVALKTERAIVYKNFLMGELMCKMDMSCKITANGLERTDSSFSPLLKAF